MVWLLEELQAVYRPEIVSFPKDGGLNVDPRNPHPHGYTPALEHERALVTERWSAVRYFIKQT
jgi:glutathione S-transferase